MYQNTSRRHKADPEPHVNTQAKSRLRLALFYWVPELISIRRSLRVLQSNTNTNTTKANA